MKVPPLQDLIVCVIPPQSIVRHIVLAAAAHVLVLCGAASAQSVPAAPPLNLWNAVEVKHGVLPNGSVLLEQSPDLALWEAAGSPAFGETGEITRFVSAGASPQAYFRLKTTVRPADGFGRWDLTGSRLLLNTAREVRLLTFDGNAAGTAQSAEEQTSFTWRWLRTGTRTGRLAVTWPGGLEESLELDFSASNAGAFTSRRSRNGLPAGADAGVFRDAESTGLAVSVPESPGDCTLVLSNTGRPVSVSLSASGTASLSIPGGAQEYSVNYSVTGGGSAEVWLSCESGALEIYRLTFSGPGCGEYEMSSHLNGGLRRAGGGSFTIAPR